MAYYPIFKILHIMLALFSIFLFNLRFLMRQIFPYRTLRLFWRRLPHIVDAFFLITGIVLAVMIDAVPFFNAQWFGIKLGLLVFYILFGSFALKTRPRGAECIFNYIMSMMCVLLMILLAMYKPSFW